MTEIKNSIVIAAPLDRVWSILTDLPELAEYDPTVAASNLTSQTATGVGASRKVTMQDGKHWFAERVSAFEPGEALTFELTACNFPIKSLRHSYTFAETAGKTTVSQVMTYTPKFGLLGKLMDAMMIRRNSDRGVKAFFAGLKSHAERPSEARS